MKWYRLAFVALLCCLVLLLSLPIVVYIPYRHLSEHELWWTSCSRSPFVILHSKFGTGSGFLCKYGGNVFIMTARHVIMGSVSPLKTVECFDCAGNRIGVATPWLIDDYRDIALCLASGDTYSRLPYQPFEVADMSVEQLKSLAGQDAWYHGTAGVGEWLRFNSFGFAGFSERTTIVRVVPVKHNLRMLDTPFDKGLLDDQKDMVMITVKGGVWYGCSGGPLVYDGKVIGVCSMVENFTPKAGAVYIYPGHSLKELLGK